LRAELGRGAGEPVGVQPAPGAELQVDLEVRRAWEIEFPDALHDEILARINALRDLFERDFSVRVSPADAVAALRYPKGAFYRAHRDRAARPDAHGLHRRAVSIVIFVNGGEEPTQFEGGRLRFHAVGRDGALDVTPIAGTLVAFPSSLLHEVTPVTWGTRLTLVTWLQDRGTVP
jgi:predicted 2-oxoglutarate/Fe(II)-dependent dioxygenase YbiX